MQCYFFPPMISLGSHYGIISYAYDIKLHHDGYRIGGVDMISYELIFPNEETLTNFVHF